MKKSEIRCFSHIAQPYVHYLLVLSQSEMLKLQPMHQIVAWNQKIQTWSQSGSDFWVKPLNFIDGYTSHLLELQSEFIILIALGEVFCCCVLHFKVIFSSRIHRTTVWSIRKEAGHSRGGKHPRLPLSLCSPRPSSLLSVWSSCRLTERPSRAAAQQRVGTSSQHAELQSYCRALRSSCCSAGTGRGWPTGCSCRTWQEGWTSWLWYHCELHFVLFLCLMWITINIYVKLDVLGWVFFFFLSEHFSTKH